MRKKLVEQEAAASKLQAELEGATADRQQVQAQLLAAENKVRACTRHGPGIARAGAAPV